MGFAAGYGALRAVIAQVREDMKGVSADAKLTSAALQTVTADARHYQAQLAAQATELSDLDHRVRMLEIEMARVKSGHPHGI